MNILMKCPLRMLSLLIYYSFFIYCVSSLLVRENRVPSKIQRITAYTGRHPNEMYAVLHWVLLYFSHSTSYNSTASSGT